MTEIAQAEAPPVAPPGRRPCGRCGGPLPKGFVRWCSTACREREATGGRPTFLYGERLDRACITPAPGAEVDGCPCALAASPRGRCPVCATAAPRCPCTSAGPNPVARMRWHRKHGPTTLREPESMRGQQFDCGHLRAGLAEPRPRVYRISAKGQELEADDVTG